MPEVTASKYRVEAGWDDVPHLTEAAKRELLDSTMPYLRDARSKGIPSLGAGAIYPIPVSEITCEPFKVPGYYRRLYGLDVGWKCTAAVWGAHDLDTDIIYAYTEHYRGQAEPSIHAAAIKARGAWIPGAIDPASRGRSQLDGQVLIDSFREQGLLLTEAINAVEAGLYQVFVRLSTGRLKIFKTCQNILSEYRLYRRDEKGVRVKDYDHAMDALRYMVMTIGIAVVQPVPSQTGSSIIADPRAGY